MKAKVKPEKKYNGLTFQDLILKLSQFWVRQGCVLQQPYDVEVGAGTMHPETFLRVLGPAAYRVAYAQPSRRPADGRYGENPNRLYKHLQFQVILKPAPVDVQELYLKSLTAIGIELGEHDIRFEEDNWESPTLGAWGIGWQVLLDGQEIKLTAREFDLLSYLLAFPSRVHTRDVLLENVWGREFNGDRKTVDVHIRWLREKFETRAPFEIVTVRGIGYRMDRNAPLDVASPQGV